MNWSTVSDGRDGGWGSGLSYGKTAVGGQEVFSKIS